MCHLAHVNCRHHRPGHAPHELPDRELIICFCAPMHQISKSRCGRKEHHEKCRTHVAEEQRAMLCVIGWRVVFERGDCPLQKHSEHGVKVLCYAGGTDAMQIIQRPYDTGRTPVKTGITVCHSIVTRVPRPELFGIEMGDCIGRNFFDYSADSQFTPRVMCKRTMTTKGNHARGPPERDGVHPFGETRNQRLVASATACGDVLLSRHVATPPPRRSFSAVLEK